MMKFNFNNIKVGDRIMTDEGQTGIVVMLRSYAYINDLILRNATNVDTILIDLLPFKFDNVRHQNVDYPTVTVAVESEEYGKKVYYLVDVDFNNIKQVIVNDDVQEEEPVYKRIVKMFLNSWNKYIEIIKNKIFQIL